MSSQPKRWVHEGVEYELQSDGYYARVGSSSTASTTATTTVTTSGTTADDGLTAATPRDDILSGLMRPTLRGDELTAEQRMRLAAAGRNKPPSPPKARPSIPARMSTAVAPSSPKGGAGPSEEVSTESPPRSPQRKHKEKRRKSESRDRESREIPAPKPTENVNAYPVVTPAPHGYAPAPSSPSAVALDTLQFDTWKYADQDLVPLMAFMFQDLGLVKKFNIKESALHSFLNAIRAGHADVPFHSFRHCFASTQLLYALLVACRETPLFLSSIDQLAVMIAACIHDLGHPGTSNSFQVVTESEMALNYNDRSCLENNACSLGFRLLRKSECNILSTLSREDRARVRAVAVAAVIATDMDELFHTLGHFQDARNRGLDCNNVDDASIVASVLLMCADQSHHLRPLQIAEQWAQRLHQEFVIQTQREEAANVPVTPFMARGAMDPEGAAIAFMAAVLRPLWRAAESALPALSPFVDALEGNLKRRASVVTRAISDSLLLESGAYTLNDAVDTVYAPGEVLCRKGELADALFLKKGTVEVLAPDGFVITVAKEGHFVGRVAQLASVPLLGDLRARTACTVAFRSGDEVLRTLEAHGSYPQAIKHLRAVEKALAWRNPEPAERRDASILGIPLSHLVHCAGG